MNRTVLITVFSAIVLAAVLGMVTMQFLGSDGSMNHQMDDGSMMTGTMPGGTLP